jgi:hypothetical protein
MNRELDTVDGYSCALSLAIRNIEGITKPWVGSAKKAAGQIINELRSLLDAHDPGWMVSTWTWNARSHRIVGYTPFGRAVAACGCTLIQLCSCSDDHLRCKSCLAAEKRSKEGKP